MARVAEPVLGPSDFSTPWCGMAQVHGRRTWREGQPGIRRPGPHAQVESSSEQWRDAAGSLPTFGIRLHRRLARMLIEAYDGTDFGPSRNGDGGYACWRAQCARVWEGDGATARAVCRPSVSSHAHRCLHPYFRGRSMGQISDHRETVMGAMPAGAHSVRECGRATTRRRGQYADLRYPVTHRRLHPCCGAGARWGRVWTIEKR